MSRLVRIRGVTAVSVGSFWGFLSSLTRYQAQQSSQFRKQKWRSTISDFPGLGWVEMTEVIISADYAIIFFSWSFGLQMAMAQNYQTQKWMVFRLNMIISVVHLVPKF